MPVAQSDALQSALAAVKAAIGELPAEYQVRLNLAMQQLEPVIAGELETVADSYLNRIPVFGGIADSLINGAITKALDDGLAQLTAAKAKIGV